MMIPSRPAKTSLLRRLCILLSLSHITKAAWIETAVLMKQQQQEQEGRSYDGFGWAVAIDKGIIAVGVRGNSTSFQDAGSGSVSIYQEVEGEWSQQQRLVASDAQEFDRLGYAVAIHNDTLVAGAPWEDGVGFGAGAVYVYEKQEAAGGSSMMWTQQAKLVLRYEVLSRGLYMVNLAIQGSTIIAGTLDDDSAYVYTRLGGSWTESAKLTPSNVITSLEDFTFGFGWAVAISEETIVVGALYNDVYLFQLEGELWTEQAKLIPSDGTRFGAFGYAVAIEGDTVCVADETDTGSVYIFTGQGSSWSQQAKIVPSDTAHVSWFGRSLALRDGMLVVGSDDVGFDNSTIGAVYLFRSVEDAWTQQARLVASDGVADNRFGWAVDFEDGVVIAGADGSNEWRGSAHVFEWRGSSTMPSVAPSQPSATSSAFPSVEPSVPTTMAVVFIVCYLFRD